MSPILRNTKKRLVDEDFFIFQVSKWWCCAKTQKKGCDFLQTWKHPCIFLTRIFWVVQESTMDLRFPERLKRISSRWWPSRDQTSSPKIWGSPFQPLIERVTFSLTGPQISGHKLAELPGWCSFYDDSPLRRLDSFDSFDQADACSLKWPTPEKPLKVWPCLLASFEVTLYTGSPVCCTWVVPAMNHLWPDHSPGFLAMTPKKERESTIFSSNWNFLKKKQQQQQQQQQQTPSHMHLSHNLVT